MIPFPDAEADPAVIFTLDPALRFTYCNAAWDRFAESNGGARVMRAIVIGRPLAEFVSGELAGFYSQAYGRVLQSGVPWRFEYECSSAEVLRKFAMHVYAVERGAGLMVVNSLLVERPHGDPARSALEELYRGPDGFIVMCSNCRRTRVNIEDHWDWVPDFVKEPPEHVSHGLCGPCKEYYFAALRNVGKAGQLPFRPFPEQP